MTERNTPGGEPWRRAARPSGYGEHPDDDEGYGGSGDRGGNGDRGDSGDYGDQPTRSVPPPRRSAAASTPEADDAEQTTNTRRRAGGRGNNRGTGHRGRTGDRDDAAKTGAKTVGRIGPKAVVAVSASSLLVTVVGTGVFTYQHFDKAINTSADGGLVKDSQRPAPAQANAAGQKPMNILMIGSDSRDDGNDAYGAGKKNGARSDTTILLHIYADHQHAVGISIPRDLLVDLPACLYDQTKPDGQKSTPRHYMFNAAFAVGDTAAGNPVCTRDTVESMSGIRVDHTVVLGFEAFAKLTDDIHGVPVCVPNNIVKHSYDSITLRKGIQTVSGKAALDYVRERDGLGDGSDVSRTRRQQAFLGSMIKKVEGDGVLNDPTALAGILNDALKYAQFDKGLGTLSALGEFADSLKGINPAHIQFMTLPGHYRTTDSKVDLDVASAKVVWDHLRSDTLLDGTNAAGSAGTASPSPTSSSSPTSPSAQSSGAPSSPTSGASSIPPASISVRVLNGTLVTGLAGDTTSSLQARGYNAVLDRTKATAVAVTTIVYPSGKQAAAQQLATMFPGAKLVAGGTGTQLVVTVGDDVAASRGKGTAAAPSNGTSSLPTAIADNSRTADQDICTGITAGF